MAVQARLRLHQIGQKEFFLMPSTGAFEMRNAKNLGFWRGTRSAHTSAFGVALQMGIPLHQICQKESFWVPSMGLFEMCNPKKCGVFGVALQAHIPLH